MNTQYIAARKSMRRGTYGSGLRKSGYPRSHFSSHRWWVGMLSVCCVLLLAACGHTSQTGSSQTNEGQANTSTTHMNTTIDQAELSLTTTAQTNTNPVKVVKVQITFSDFHILSSIMTFTAGIPYHFTVINKGKAIHGLMLLSTVAKTVNKNGKLLREVNQVTLVSLTALKPGTTKTFDYTFRLSTAGTHPAFFCYLPGHSKTGIKLGVRVQ